MKRTLILAVVATAVAGQVQARDYISIVGSRPESIDTEELGR